MSSGPSRRAERGLPPLGASLQEQAYGYAVTGRAYVDLPPGETLESLAGGPAAVAEAMRLMVERTDRAAMEALMADPYAVYKAELLR